MLHLIYMNHLIKINDFSKTLNFFKIKEYHYSRTREEICIQKLQTKKPQTNNIYVKL